MGSDGVGGCLGEGWGTRFKEPEFVKEKGLKRCELGCHIVLKSCVG